MSNKTIKLEGPALDIAAKMHDAFWKAHNEQADLRREFDRRMERSQEEARRALSGYWAQLLRAAGLQHENPAEWGLDARYWEEHGLMFVTHNVVDDNPAAMQRATRPPPGSLN